MRPERFARIKEIVLGAMARPIPERDLFLDDMCEDDVALRRDVDGLLAYDEATIGDSRAMLNELIRESVPLDQRSTTAISSPSAFASGDLLGERYRIERFLGRGGMGLVYEALDELLSVRVALKTLRVEGASEAVVAEAVRLLKREVLLARTVTHPHVCRTYDMGQHGDGTQAVWFLTMELVPGETLLELIKRRGRLPREEALPLVEQMASALGAAHRAGIVHRDFKSGNVMVVGKNGDTNAVVMDFGLARAVAPRRHAPPGPTEPDVGAAAPPQRLVGTPAYMAPEQVLGLEAAPASDIYALGVVLYEMVTGGLPFDGDSPWEVALRRVTDEPLPPRTHAPELGERWEATILRCLARDPAQRFLRAEDVPAVLAGRRSLDAVVTGPSRPPCHLPAEADAFVGRTVELEALHRRLIDNNRLVTLLGPGGIGKTRLALRYGWQQLEAWPGGVWFCELREARNVEGVALAVATALNVPLGKGNPIIQLGHAIAGRGRSLIIMDNFEQATDHAAETLGEWLQLSTETRFLVTSRERLRLPGEVTEALETMDPAGDGRELFTARGREHRPRLEVDEANRELVERIVETLDGLPLAIELAASRLRVLTLEQLRDRLADRFELLVGGKRGRHETLRTALDWSWELLEPWERSAVAQASVFEGGFTLEAAEAVIDISAYPAARPVLDVIQSLVDKSWLRARVELQEPRFRMYAMVQAYASEKLRAERATEEAGTQRTCPEAVERRHGEYFAAMGTHEAIDGLGRHGGTQRRAALRRELENLVVACRRAATREEPETAVRTLAASWEVLSLVGPGALGVDLGQLVRSIPEIRPAYRARASRVFGRALRFVGRMEAARRSYEQAIAIHREIGNRGSEGTVLGDLGNLHHNQGRMDEARRHHEQALVIHREVGDQRSEGIMLGNLGNNHWTQGRMDEARRHYEQALTIHREIGNRRYEGIVLGSLGSLHYNQGRMKEARRCYEQALAIHREVENRRFEGNVLGGLAGLHYAQSRMEEASHHCLQAIAIHREVGDRASEGTALGHLGILHREQGHPEEAQMHYQEALAIHRELGDRLSEGIVLGNLGSLHHIQGRMEDALRLYEDAIVIHREVGNRRLEGIVLGSLGSLHRSQGRVPEAWRHCEDALAIHREVGSRRFEGVQLDQLGLLHETQGQMAAATRCYEEALSIHREVGNRAGEAIALGELGGVHFKEGRIQKANRRIEQGITILREIGDGLELGKLLCLQGEFRHGVSDLPAARASLAEAETIAESLDVTPDSELACKVNRLRLKLSV